MSFQADKLLRLQDKLLLDSIRWLYFTKNVIKHIEIEKSFIEAYKKL